MSSGKAEAHSLSLRQLIYRTEIGAPLAVRDLTLGKFHYCAGPGEALQLWRASLRLFGPLRSFRMMLRLATKSRDFVCVSSEGEIAAYASVAISFCKHYPVENGAVVLGGVWTDPRHRGRGL